MKDIVKEMERIGQNYSINQFDDLSTLLARAKASFIDANFTNESDQMCIILPVDDDDTDGSDHTGDDDTDDLTDEKPAK